MLETHYAAVTEAKNNPQNSVKLPMMSVLVVMPRAGLDIQQIVNSIVYMM